MILQLLQSVLSFELLQDCSTTTFSRTFAILTKVGSLFSLRTSKPLYLTLLNVLSLWRWGFTGLSAHRLVVITLFHFEIASCQRMRYISRRSSTEVNQVRIHSPLSSRGTPWPLYLSVLLTLCHFGDKSLLVFLPIAILLLRCPSDKLWKQDPANASGTPPGSAEVS